MYCDYHVHSIHSADCSIPMEEQVMRAVELGIDELCFTDHVELGLKAWGKIEIDLQPYHREIERMRARYPQISLKFGIEAGISCPEEHFERLKSMMCAMPFDFVIASAHTLKGKSVMREQSYEGDGLAQVCREYIPSILQRLRRLDPDSYSCVGHIDFPWKGALRLYPGSVEYSYAYAPDEMDALFSFIIEQGKCLEVNTSPWEFWPRERLKGPDWLKRYAQLGGEYITIGSDSHQTANTGAFFKEAVAFAREAGVKYLAVFDQMKPVFYPLSRL